MGISSGGKKTWDRATEILGPKRVQDFLEKGFCYVGATCCRIPPEVWFVVCVGSEIRAVSCFEYPKDGKMHWLAIEHFPPLVQGSVADQLIHVATLIATDAAGVLEMVTREEDLQFRDMQAMNDYFHKWEAMLEKVKAECSHYQDRAKQCLQVEEGPALIEEWPPVFAETVRSLPESLQHPAEGLEQLDGNLVRAIEIIKELARTEFEREELTYKRQLIWECEIANAYLHCGCFEQAVELYGDIRKRQAQHEVEGSYPIDPLSQLAYPLFVLGRYREALGEIEQCPEALNMRYCKIALLALREAHGEHALEEETFVASTYPKVYNAALRCFGNHASALVVMRSCSVSELSESKGLPRKAAFELAIQWEAKRDRTEFRKPVQDVFDRVLQLLGERSYDEALICIEKLGEQQQLGVREESRRSKYRAFTLLVAGRFGDFIELHRESGRVSTWWSDEFNDLCFSILLQEGEDLTGADVANLCWKRHFFHDAPLTDPGRFTDRAGEFNAHCERALSAFRREHGVGLLQWAAEAHPDDLHSKGQVLESCYRLLPGFNLSKLNRTLLEQSALNGRLKSVYAFSSMAGFQAVLDRILSEGERRLGVQWKSQAAMVQLLREAFPSVRVEAEASPPWLANLRFDTYLPELRLAVEFQGEQHYRPVEVFGGEEGFRAVEKYDRLKAELASANNTSLEYIRYDEDVEERIAEIASKYGLPPKGPRQLSLEWDGDKQQTQ